METRTLHSQSPQPSPHGAIGDNSATGTATGVASGVAAIGVVGTPPSSTHGRSASFATRPRTPAAATGGSGDDLDLSAMISHGQRQLELDRSRFGRFGIAPASAGANVGTGVIGGPGNGVGAVGQQQVAASRGRGESPSRWDDEWRHGSRSRDTSMRRQGSASGLQANPAPNLAFLDQSFPSPLGRPRPPVGMQNPAPVPSDPAAAAQHHMQALSNVLSPLIAQNDELIRLRAEVELWRGEWQRCDRERRRLEGVVNAKNDEPVNGPSFTAVLLDGDGLIFQDEYLRKGFAGGQQAARVLVSSLPSLTGKVFSPRPSVTDISAPDSEPKSADFPRELGQVVVQLFVNKSGLGHALLKAGSIPAWTVYDSFWQGFTSAHDLFSVIDAGHGKEATDAKIREHLKLYTAHRQCGTIVLGASHDNSYASVLSSLETEGGLNKLVLLKGYSDLAAGLRPYSNRVITLPDLFRTSRLPPVTALNLYGQATSGAIKSPMASKPPMTKSPMPPKSPMSARKPHFAAVAAAPVPSPIATPTSATAFRSTEDDDEASVASSDAPSSVVTTPDDMLEVYQWDDSAESPSRPSHAARTQAGAGKAQPQPPRPDDEDLVDGKKKGKKYKPAARAASVPTVRNLKPRPCHTFYLSPWGCKNGDGCEYAHHYKLNEEQTEELARLAKEIICPYVRSKRCHFSEDECVYGHRCPRGERCTFGETCRFKDLPNGHGEDSRAAAATAAPASAPAPMPASA